MGLHHDNPNPLNSDALRTQRMTADEAKSVIALWQQERVEQTGLTDRPAVPDVAEGLDIPVEEVQRLLAEVRARRLEEERALAQEQRLAEAETRLLEEEFRLAEVQQQRAEVLLAKAERRGQNSSGRQGAKDEPVPWEIWKATHSPMRGTKTKPATRKDTSQVSSAYNGYNGLESRRVFWVLVKVYGCMLLLICLSLIIYFSLTTSQGKPPQAGDCILTLPDGTSQPCGPDFDRAHPDFK